MADIFISYRRQDSPSATGRLAEALQARFGERQVFRDLDSIALGDDFAAALQRAMRSARVALVVIGPDWLVARSADGARRLDDPSDFVRREIEAALDEGVALVPVLVEGATMPAAQALPASIAALAGCQAAELTESRWHFDAGRLMTGLEARFGLESHAAPDPAARSGGPSRVLRFGLDLIDLAAHPTRMIARAQTGAASDAGRAFGFLLACCALGTALLLTGVGVRLDPAAPGGLFAMLKLLGAGVLVDVLVTAALAAVLTLAWRLCGVPAGYRRVGLVFAYVASGVWLGFGLGALVLTTGVQLGDAQVFARISALLYAPDPAGVVDLGAAARWQAAQALMTRALQGRAALPVALAGLAVWGATAFWSLVAWGAFRHAFNVGRGRAALATLLWLALLLGLVWLAARIG